MSYRPAPLSKIIQVDKTIYWYECICCGMRYHEDNDEEPTDETYETYKLHEEQCAKRSMR